MLIVTISKTLRGIIRELTNKPINKDRKDHIMKRRATAILLGIMVSSMFLSACEKNDAKEAANESAQVEEEGVGEVTEEGEKVEAENKQTSDADDSSKTEGSEESGEKNSDASESESTGKDSSENNANQSDDSLDDEVTEAPAGKIGVLLSEEDENAKIKEVIKAAAGTVEKLADGNVKVYVHGIPAHAAFPEGSESAEVKLAGLLIRSGVLDEDAKELMEAICDMFGDYYGAGLDVPFEDEGSGKLTHVGGMCKLENGVFWQNVNIRYNVTAVYEVMMENIGKCLKSHGFELTGSHNSSPCFTDPNSKEVQALLEVCCRSLGMELEPYVMGGGTYSRKLKHAVGFGPGIPGKEKRFGTERGGAHQADEYIEIEHLKKAFEIYVEAIKKLDEVVD